MLRKHAILPVVCLSLILPCAWAATDRFSLSQHGQPVGEASCRVAPAAGGSTSTAIVHVSLNGLSYTLSTEVELNRLQQLTAAEVNGTVNGSAVQLSLTNRAPTLALTQRANGRTSQTTLAGHANLVLLTDFDPCALEQVIRLEAAAGGRDLWVFVPHQAGSVVAAQMATLADESGTLDGKQITVHHLQLTVETQKTELFTDAQGRLLQAELAQPGFAAVRTGFVLTPPGKAQAPAGE